MVLQGAASTYRDLGRVRGSCQQGVTPPTLPTLSRAAAEDLVAVDHPEVEVGVRAWGYIRLSLRSTAQPLYTRFPIIFSSCFSKVTIGYSPIRAVVAEGLTRGGEGRGADVRGLAAGGGVIGRPPPSARAQPQLWPYVNHKGLKPRF